MTKLAKHIKTKFHHIRDLYEHRAINPLYVNTRDQIADVQTKGLNPVDHLRICRKFMFLPEKVVMPEIETPKDMQRVVRKLMRRNMLKRVATQPS